MHWHKAYPTRLARHGSVTGVQRLEHDPALLQPARTVLHQGLAAERDRIGPVRHPRSTTIPRIDSTVSRLLAGTRSCADVCTWHNTAQALDLYRAVCGAGPRPRRQPPGARGAGPARRGRGGASRAAAAPAALTGIAMEREPPMLAPPPCRSWASVRGGIYAIASIASGVSLTVVRRNSRRSLRSKRRPRWIMARLSHMTRSPTCHLCTYTRSR